MSMLNVSSQKGTWPLYLPLLKRQPLLNIRKSCLPLLPKTLNILHCVLRCITSSYKPGTNRCPRAATKSLQTRHEGRWPLLALGKLACVASMAIPAAAQAHLKQFQCQETPTAYSIGVLRRHTHYTELDPRWRSEPRILAIETTLDTGLVRILGTCTTPKIGPREMRLHYAYNGIHTYM